LKATDALLEQYEEVEYAVKQEIREVTREKVELGGLLQQRIELFKGHPSRIPIIQKGEPLYLFVDQRGLATCLDNLLSNAVKYNRSEGQVTAEIRQEHLLIQDNGIGMTPEEVVYIYDRYYQADRTQKGMGIGLSLVKRFCDEHRVPITIHSEKDQGTTVELDFSACRIQGQNLHN